MRVAHFETVTIVPNTYHHPQRDIDTVVHGDDFVAVAENGQLGHFEQVLEFTGNQASREDRAQSLTGKARKRVVNWSGDGFTWEADPRLTEKLINMLNLSGEKGALTHGSKDIGKDDCDIDCELDYSDAKLMQAAAGLEQHIAPDTASRRRCSRWRTPRLKNNRKLVWKYPYQQQPKSIDVFVDADFEARHVAVYFWYRGVLRESANRVCVQHAERAGAHLAQPFHPERLRSDGGGRCPIGRKRRHWDRITVAV